MSGELLGRTEACAYVLVVAQAGEGVDFSITGVERTGKTNRMVAAELVAIARKLDPESNFQRGQVRGESSPRL